MRMISQVRTLLLVLTVGALAQGRIAAAAVVPLPLIQEERIEASIPILLRGLLLANPYVAFWVSLDETGRVIESMPIFATHYGLLEAADARLRGVTFKPTRDAQGRPVASVGQVTISFYDPSQRAYFQRLTDLPSANTTGDALERKMYDMNPSEYTYRQAKPSELDRPLEIVEATVVLVKDENDKPAQGRCEVEYWVDLQGIPRFARVLKSDNDTVTESAMRTLRRTRFVPPKRDGAPTCVKVVQPMELDTAK